VSQVVISNYWCLYTSMIVTFVVQVVVAIIVCVYIHVYVCVCTGFHLEKKHFGVEVGVAFPCTVPPPPQNINR
jgi:hypothetical protein